MIQETDGTNAPTVSYILGGTELLAQTRGTARTYYLQDGQAGSNLTISRTKAIFSV